MPTSPLPNFAGGRPLPAASAAAGVRALRRAPPPTRPPPARPAFFRNPALVSPSSASFASCAASRTTASISEPIFVLLRFRGGLSPTCGGREPPDHRKGNLFDTKSAQNARECVILLGVGRDPQGMD